MTKPGHTSTQIKRGEENNQDGQLGHTNNPHQSIWIFKITSQIGDYLICAVVLVLSVHS